jgi:hypothetical protein
MCFLQTYLYLFLLFLWVHLWPGLGRVRATELFVCLQALNRVLLIRGQWQEGAGQECQGRQGRQGQVEKIDFLHQYQ